MNEDTCPERYVLVAADAAWHSFHCTKPVGHDGDRHRAYPAPKVYFEWSKEPPAPLPPAVLRFINTRGNL